MSSANSAASDFVIINDVSPRDGLQNQAQILTPAQRLAHIGALLDAGVANIEIGSFVSPKAVPAMAGTDEVFAGLPRGAASYSVLIPNRRGYDIALRTGVETVLLVMAASETMNQKNVNMSVQQSLDICADLIAAGKADGKKTIMCVATAWECPFEGIVDEAAVESLVRRCIDAGAQEIVLADTIGAADPASVKSLLTRLVGEFGASTFGCHFHDTRGFGVADVYAALECGVRKFDASVGGLGGCPFAPGASGNVATEDVVLMLHQMGMTTGIDLPALLDAADLVWQLTQTSTGGNASTWMKRQVEKGETARFVTR